ncbi:uncharacterized protein HMPREF1120_02860 [Exophiala dermatitidis NIH/UT8656]|uniref:Uncharacterized protein n=1 Tax=Exophiala dermatitidis (strain ATCC 34100 / CBS 525.76 / NIH/UT8656) TaxID=858893 RepID=H6BRB4_EXODN|nr:uncharacterized protein HMPREF1120_02860 [Exophiala dermatitidis NIH/UT8656]EHY54695.1 hypothetical protein HMPREF1120_02860 [Exophiala dermatitidis NIH/UT8656]
MGGRSGPRSTDAPRGPKQINRCLVNSTSSPRRRRWPNFASLLHGHLLLRNLLVNVTRSHSLFAAGPALHYRQYCPKLATCAHQRLSLFPGRRHIYILAPLPCSSFPCLDHLPYFLSLIVARSQSHEFAELPLSPPFILHSSSARSYRCARHNILDLPSYQQRPADIRNEIVSIRRRSLDIASNILQSYPSLDYLERSRTSTANMRFTSAIAAIALLSTPAVLAQESSDATITVTSSYSTTLTVTKTLTYAFAHANTNVTTTSTTSSFQPTGWNVTSTVTESSSSSFNKTTLTPASSSSVSSETSAAPSIAQATGAASAQEINLAVAALAGLSAMIWGSL